MLRSLISTRYPQTCPPAAKSAPLALLAPAINLCSKLWTREIPETSYCLLNLCNCLRRKEAAFQGARILLSLGLRGRDYCKPLIKNMLKFNLLALFKGHKWLVLNTNPIFLYFCYPDHFGGQCKRADYFFGVWNTVWWVHCRGNVKVMLDPCFVDKVWKPNKM